MQPPVPSGLIGSAPVRVDGAAKVAGTARYGADHTPAHAVHAALVTAPIARGRITAIDDTATLGTPGVLLLLTYRNIGKAIKGGKPLPEGGYMSGSVAPLASDRVHFAGQIVAVVVATSHEIAEEAARLLQITYGAEEPGVTLNAKSAKDVKPKALAETELSAGDFEKAYKTAPVCVDAWYETPAQVHNPMELFQSTCEWSTGKDGKPFLTVWESAQHTRGYQYGLAQQLGLKPKQVRVFANFIGGAFGSRGELGQATALIAWAARELEKPVKWVGSRREGFTLRTFRAETRHHVQIAADHEGHLQALSHESWELTSRAEQFATAGSDTTVRIYACPNIRTKVHNLATDRQPPGFMRAPPETPYMFASESAMDELSYKLGLDPLELRRRNETDTDPVSGKPYSSRSVLRCIETGADAFGWAKRNPVPRSMQADNGDLIGYGYATAFYPTQIGPADCRLTLGPGLHARVEVGTHEIGTGIRTVATQTAADLLGLPLEAVELVIGDSDLPAAPLSAGSNSTASICSVIAVACEQARVKLARAAVADKGSTLHGADPAHVRLTNGVARVLEPGQGNPEEPLDVTFLRCTKGGTITENATNTPEGVPPLLGPAMVRKGKALITGGPKPKDHVQFAQGAQFVEVHVNPHTGEIKVARMVGAFAGGRIMNPRTANNQLVGGQVWGVGAALLESAELDLPLGRYANNDLAEYHVAVNADIPDVTAVLIEEHDSMVNPLGIKGVGELGITGVNAAIANAVYHATGVRLRKLPIRPEHVLLAAT